MHMKVSCRIIVYTALLAPAVALAQSSATVSNVTASARIYKPITLALSNTGLSFGDIFSDATGGLVTLNPQTEVRTTAGPVLAATGTVNAAHFAVTGKRSATYAITLPGSITLSGPGTAMTVNAFTASVGGGAPSNPATGTLSTPAGTQTFNVGAALTLGANQVDGDYSGTFNVTVTYN
jgi:hypothetical protein